MAQPSVVSYFDRMEEARYVKIIWTATISLRAMIDYYSPIPAVTSKTSMSIALVIKFAEK
jgi:hypothetical protein